MLKPAVAAAANRPALRYARRDDLGGKYRWDWHVPGTVHESAGMWRTHLVARLSAWWWERNARRAGVVEILPVPPTSEGPPEPAPAVDAATTEMARAA